MKRKQEEEKARLQREKERKKAAEQSQKQEIHPKPSLLVGQLVCTMDSFLKVPGGG